MLLAASAGPETKNINSPLALAGSWGLQFNPHLKSGVSMATRNINTALPSDECQGDLADGHGISARRLLVNGRKASPRGCGLCSAFSMLSRGLGSSASSRFSAQHLCPAHKVTCFDKKESELPSGLLLGRG